MKVPVLLPKVFNYPFTYINEPKNRIKLNLGDIVEVSFGNKKELGVIWDKINSTKKNIKLKPVEKKISKVKLSKKLIKFINWFSTYNLSSKGLVLKMCLANQKKLKI